MPKESSLDARLSGDIDENLPRSQRRVSKADKRKDKENIEEFLSIDTSKPTPNRVDQQDTQYPAQRYLDEEQMYEELRKRRGLCADVVEITGPARTKILTFNLSGQKDIFLIRKQLNYDIEETMIKIYGSDRATTLRPSIKITWSAYTCTMMVRDYNGHEDELIKFLEAYTSTLKRRTW